MRHPAFTAIALALALTATAARAHDVPAPDPALRLVAAQERLQQGDAEGAAKALDALAGTLGDDPGYWRLRAQLEKTRGRHDVALAAWHRHLALMPGSAAAHYAIAALHALRGDRQAALDALRRAAATRRVDLGGLPYDADFASLHADPELRALLPWESTFAPAFVEDVAILREWRGERVNDQFGWIARALGDVDGDGSVDIVTSAPTSDRGGEGAGRVYVYSVRTGSLLWSVDGAPGDGLGTGVERAGDADGDGIPDVVACGPGGATGGVAAIHSGRDGKLLQRMQAEAKDDAFGSHCEGVGDVDGDGRGDVIVGAPANDAGGADAGRAYVFSGATGARLQVLTGERAGDRFGAAVTGWADGGRRVLAIGAPRAGAERHGRVYVHRDGATRADFVADAGPTGRALGAMFVSIPGDLDGDGMVDIYATDWADGARGVGTGRAYAWSGADGRTLLTLGGETAGEGFGTTQGVAGDVDGDGRADLVVGAWQYGAHASGAGRVVVHSGRDGRVLATISSRIAGDTFGFDAVGIGDVDGDRQVDLLITAAWSGVSGFHSGRVFVVSSGVEPLPAAPAR